VINAVSFRMVQAISYHLLTVLFVLLCVGFFLIRNLTDVNYLYVEHLCGESWV
jgi:hypothetical protein